MPKVSIIIPIYNVEQYLRQCLDSVINQTLTDIEIICVNDCSPDNSISIIKEYEHKDSRIKTIDFKENKGPGIARNLALDIAQGEYIMFLDPDDWLELDACETVYNQISQNNNNMLIFGYNRYIEKTQKSYLKLDTVSPYIPFSTNKNIKFSDLDINWLKNAHTWFYAYNKKFLDNNKIRYGEFHLCEDVPFIVKATYFAKDISVIVKPLYNYRARNTATNQSSKNYLWHDLIDARRVAIDFLNTFDDKEKNIPYILYIVRTLLYWFVIFSSRVDYKIQKQFYCEIKNMFRKIESKYHILNNEKAKFNKRRYKKIISKSFEGYLFDSFIKNVLTMTNYKINGSKYKTISIFKEHLIIGFRK